MQFIDVASGGDHTCGIRTDGVALCWGGNDVGQLGTGTTTAGSAAPVTVNTNQRFASISAAPLRTCARAADGAAFCWGTTWVGRLGGEELVRAQATPQRVQGTLFLSVAAGAVTTCGIGVDGKAYCWESNALGTLGDSTSSGSRDPRAVTGPGAFAAVSVGGAQACGIAATGLAYCWGNGASGQLGTSPLLLHNNCGVTRAPCAPSPIPVSGWRVFSEITAGQGTHACGLTMKGNVYCWGAGGMGQRGDGRISAAEWSPVKTRSP
jgi:alpha-tubulin suppressor-like RCC1 family protein